ncbi:P-loop containing nucleoside triphosphate hydrolase protein [Phycomyces nitens]|nr:P-loop containing nucleoside triphosphate hydrolase protein [Phycomyces nitens]
MAGILEADVYIVREIILGNPKFAFHSSFPDNRVVEALVKKANSTKSQWPLDIRIAIVGGSNAGKSTLLGRIAHGERDNGNGVGRMSLLRHRHEIASGNTSSIAHEIIGYDSGGSLINFATMHITTWEQICEQSSKLVTLLDTCGHPKYLKTTISGLTGYAPDYACLVVSGNAGRITDMTHEHLLLAVMLNVPVFVVVTKTDIATPDQLGRTLRSLFYLLKSPLINKTPVVVQDSESIVSCAADLVSTASKIPIFMVSNVMDTNISHLEHFFELLPKPTREDSEELLVKPVEFQIESVYSLPDVGAVIGGVLQKGSIDIRDSTDPQTYFLGPDSEGTFVKIMVSSMHRHRMPVHYASCGQTATLAVYSPDRKDLYIKKGMFVLGADTPECFVEFEAEFSVLYHKTRITQGACGLVHLGSVRQPARIMSIRNITEPNSRPSGPVELASGGRGICVFRFMKEPVYLCVDSRFLFTQGKSKCFGRITRLINQEHTRKNEATCRGNPTAIVYSSAIVNKG